jgi:hypothetical protein
LAGAEEGPGTAWVLRIRLELSWWPS